MTNTASTTARVPAGATTSVSLSVGDPRFCVVPETLNYDSASSFIAATAAHKSAYQAAQDRINFAPPGELMLAVGHTDDVGPSGSNMTLSERRAKGALAVLISDVGVWEDNFKTEKKLGGTPPWGDDDFRAMLLEVTGAIPPQSVIDQHRDLTLAGESLRATLFTAYFEKLTSLPGASIAVNSLAPPTLGCGEVHVLAPGTHRPSRRVEFLFFRGTSGPIIDCVNYPTWLTPCVFAPPTTITVTIASIETVRAGSIEDIQVDVNPSPLPHGTTLTLELTTTSGTGEAEFVISGSNTLVFDRSGPVRVRGLTMSDAVNNVRLTATKSGVTTILAEEDFTIVGKTSIFLKFEIWNTTTNVFDPLPNNIVVNLMDHEPLSADKFVTLDLTDVDGRVFFNIDDLEALAGVPDPDLFFRVDLGMTLPPHDLPEAWSTRGWEADDGTLGFHPSFTGGHIGSPDNPAVFRVGLDFHARVQYRVDAGPRAGSAQLIVAGVNSDDPAPPGVLVSLMQEQIGPDTALLVLRTDENGEVHGVSFEADPGSKFYLRVIFEIEDSAINFKRARFSEVPFVPPIIDVVTPAGSTFDWDSVDSDADNKDFPNHRRTSIGVFGSPEPFRCTLDDRNVAIHILKVLRELAVFLFKITQGDWKGVEVAVTPTAPVTAFSAPIGRIQLKFPNDRWDRETVIHEMAHQVMWEEVNFSTLGIVYEGAFGDLNLFHMVNLLSNAEHALIEGWAEFIEAIFEGAGTPPYNVLALVTPPSIPFTTPPPVPGGLGPPPSNRGESVEGAFANGLWGIFEDQVAGRPPPMNARVPESVNGDVTVTAPWIQTANIQTQFISMIWQPLKNLRALSNPNSITMQNNIRSQNSSDWHRLLPHLQAFNMAMSAPTVTIVNPSWGPVGGGVAFGHQATVVGDDFVESTTVPTSGAPFVSQTTVEFDGTAATLVTVTTGGSLDASPPAHVSGFVDVRVTTPAGTATLANAYLYIDEPLSIIDVIPIVVSTTGGDRIEITGQGFFSQPDTAVLVSSTPVDPAKVNVLFHDRIETEVPPGAPGDVDVAVHNPDGTFDVLSASLRYADPPGILRVDPDRGPADQTTVVLLEGLNFQPDITVESDVATLVVTPINLSATPQVITVDIPSGPPGIVPLRLFNASDNLVEEFEFFREEPTP